MIETLYRHFLNSSGVTTDSRKLREGMIFFALRGEHFDGNDFAARALGSGASLAVVDRDMTDEDPRYFRVSDSLKSLHELAIHHRGMFDIPVIGLTGTNGKTTTKELAREVLAPQYLVHATEGNLNNHIGVPLTILGITKDTEIAIIEMGANHRGEIRDLCHIAKPAFGLITNIGKAHLEGFGSYEGVIKAKSELYDYLLETQGHAFVNRDDSLLMELASGLKYNTYGRSGDAGVKGSISSSVPFLSINCSGHHIPTHLYGDYHFDNVMAAVCIGRHFGLDWTDIIRAITAYVPSNNRSQVVKKGTNTILLDAYNANPSSMPASIRHFKKLEAPVKVLILGDMLELGSSSEEEHRKVLDELGSGFSKVILVGPEFTRACKEQEYITFNTTRDAFSWLQDENLEDAWIFIKGSRGLALEQLVEAI